MLQKHKSARGKLASPSKRLFVVCSISIEITFPGGASALTETDKFYFCDSSSRNFRKILDSHVLRGWVAHSSRRMQHPVVLEARHAPKRQIRP